MLGQGEHQARYAQVLGITVNGSMEFKPLLDSDDKYQLLTCHHSMRPVSFVTFHSIVLR